MNILHTLLKNKSHNHQRIITALLLCGLFFGCLWGGEIPFFILLIGTFVLGLREWISMTKDLSPQLPWLIAGGFYIALGFVGIGLTVSYDPVLLIMILLLVWATDTGAYFIGRSLGGPKLAPHVSPGKTWSGAVGGVLLALMVGCIATRLYGYSLSFLWASGFIIISVLSILGDLLESWVKRRLGVKDSGTLLPGHGGILDRLDSPIAVGFALAVVFFLRMLS